MRQGLGVLFALALMFPFAGCGNPRPPMPPALELPQQVRDLRAVRKGDHVTLSWTVPTRTTEAQTIRYLGPTRICRSLGSPMKDCGTPAGEAPAPDLSLLLAAARRGQSQTAAYVDTLPAASSPEEQVTYALEVLNQSQRSAGFSNQVVLSAATTLPPPSDFQAQLSAEGVKLSWQPVTPAHSETGVQYFYRIYRHELSAKDSRAKDVVAANLALNATEFVDRGFEWEKTYQYRANVVTIVNRGTASNCAPDQEQSPECGTSVSIEGDDTPAVEVLAHDIFPPAIPVGLQAVYSEVGQQKFIDLIWSPNEEADLAGYNVFRREEGGSPSKINSSPVNTPAYRDPDVEPGKRYFYSVSAFDARGNQSAPSQEASESVP